MPLCALYHLKSVKAFKKTHFTSEAKAGLKNFYKGIKGPGKVFISKQDASEISGELGSLLYYERIHYQIRTIIKITIKNILHDKFLCIYSAER